MSALSFKKKRRDNTNSPKSRFSEDQKESWNRRGRNYTKYRSGEGQGGGREQRRPRACLSFVV